MKPLSGFTLIELMIVVTIGTILFGGGVAAYRGIGNKQSIKQTGISFQSNLRLIQGKANAGEKPSACGEADFIGYEVSYANETSYQVQPLCSNTDTSALITTVNLTDNIEFANNFSVIFYGLESEISGAQSINLIKDDYTYQVAIEQSGVIKGELIE